VHGFNSKPPMLPATLDQFFTHILPIIFKVNYMMSDDTKKVCVNYLYLATITVQNCTQWSYWTFSSNLL